MRERDDVDTDGPAPLVGRTVADVERELILQTLKHCGGNRTHAANILGISIRTLRNKLHGYADEGVEITPASHVGSELGRMDRAMRSAPTSP